MIMRVSFQTTLKFIVSPKTPVLLTMRIVSWLDSHLATRITFRIIHSRDEINWSLEKLGFKQIRYVTLVVWRYLANNERVKQSGHQRGLI
jgi:hypothetical protein